MARPRPVQTGFGARAARMSDRSNVPEFRSKVDVVQQSLIVKYKVISIVEVFARVGGAKRCPRLK